MTQLRIEVVGHARPETLEIDIDEKTVPTSLDVRDALLKRGGPDDAGFTRFAYRPFDNRWLYWEKDTKLLDEKRADCRPHAFEGNLWLSAAQHLRKGVEEPQAYYTGHLGSRHLIERGTLMFPAWLRDDDIEKDRLGPRRANFSTRIKRTGRGMYQKC